MLAGAAPVQASSGQVVRHRRNRGGDRQLNRALHTIVMLRQTHHGPTRAYSWNAPPPTQPAVDAEYLHQINPYARLTRIPNTDEDGHAEGWRQSKGGSMGKRLGVLGAAIALIALAVGLVGPAGFIR